MFRVTLRLWVSLHCVCVCVCLNFVIVYMDNAWFERHVSSVTLFGLIILFQSKMAPQRSKFPAIPDNAVLCILIFIYFLLSFVTQFCLLKPLWENILTHRNNSRLNVLQHSHVHKQFHYSFWSHTGIGLNNVCPKSML